MTRTFRFAGLVLVASLAMAAPVRAQVQDDLRGAYALNLVSSQGSGCAPGPQRLEVGNVTDRAIDYSLGGARATAPFFASGSTFAGPIQLGDGVGQSSGGFTRAASGAVEVNMTVRFPAGRPCQVIQLSGTRQPGSASAAAPSVPMAATPSAGLPGIPPTGMDPAPAGPVVDEVVLFGQGETNLLLILGGALLLIGFLIGLLGGRKRKPAEKPAPLVQTPVMTSPAEPEPAAPPPAPVAAQPEPAAPPLGPAPEPVSEPAPSPAPEPPEPEPEPAPEPEPEPTPEPEPAAEPEAPVAGAGHAPPPRPAKPRAKPAAKPAARAKPKVGPVARAATKPKPKPKKPAPPKT